MTSTMLLSCGGIEANKKQFQGFFARFERRQVNRRGGLAPMMGDAALAMMTGGARSALVQAAANDFFGS